MAGVTRRTRVAGLLAAGALVGGAIGVTISQLGVATAASPSPSPTPGTERHDPRGPFGHMGPLGRLGVLGGPELLMAGGKVLHGEATVQKPGGGTTVVVFQNGAITSIGGSTVTVRSPDGFTATYKVDGTTRISLNGSDGSLSTLKNNDDVRVFGSRTGSSTVAKAVVDGLPRGLGLGHLRERWQHHEQDEKAG